MTTLLIATRNPHKLGEIRAILGEAYRCVGLDGVSGAPALVENAETFEGNAASKALALARWLTETSAAWPANPTQCFIVADDSGLEVDALGGAPGVHSARFAAADLDASGNSPDAANNAKLLCLLRDVPQERRTARFRCVLALVRAVQTEPRHDLIFFEGVCEGHIAFEPRGASGFGYDPLFIPAGFKQTFAQLGEAVKNRLSHRARALAKLREWLETRGAAAIPA